MVTGRSPGNLVATRPFQIIRMDHVPSLPRSHRGNTELLIWIDQHSGYVIASPNRSRQAQEVAESYERCVYRRLGASEVIRHDREAAFMSEVFKAFNRLIGQRSKATLAYRPQANGMTERMVQTIMRAVKLYVQDSAQRDWDDYAERLILAINTAHDRVRGDTPHYIVHGWDAKTTMEVTMPGERDDPSYPAAREWRAVIQSQYVRARQDVCRRLQDAMEHRRAHQHDRARGDPAVFEPGCQVWVFVNQVKPGYTRKLAHLWHGPFRVLERVGDHLVRLEVQGTGYQFLPIVHVARLKLRQESWSRPQVDLEVAEGDRFDFDEALLPDDSWEPTAADGDYEVAEILRHRDRRSARQGRILREFEVRWVGYNEPTWVGEGGMNCPALLADCQDRLKAQGRYAVMQATRSSGMAAAQR
ncbi:hypothetical protein P43SY_011872 [Pythium insidiosum]|uniref:Reverse transcriptase n=1 Tax=Pythium insidiosum TaxID=114742 RepID=A0AAD5LRT1_PYTIN|nr:hypothetical protein P43SY_011872 [Pythium insidiosum]